MTIVEVLQPDGSTSVYTSEHRSASEIAQEVERLHPDAVLWRKSKGWRTAIDGKQADNTLRVWAVAQTVAIILALTVILTPLVAWLLSSSGVSVPAFSAIRLNTVTPHVEADEADSAEGYPAPTLGIPSQDVHIIGIAEQSSDSTRTLRIQLRNDGDANLQDVRIKAIFMDPFGSELPQDDGHIGQLSLDPGEEGYVKVWAQSEYGVGSYELEVLDPE